MQEKLFLCCKWIMKYSNLSRENRKEEHTDPHLKLLIVELLNVNENKQTRKQCQLQF